MYQAGGFCLLEVAWSFKSGNPGAALSDHKGYVSQLQAHKMSM